MSGKSPSPGLQERGDFLLVPEIPSVPSSSPSCLSVPSSFGVFPGLSPTGHTQFDFIRRGSSTASSIFDLSYEAEQLDRAIRENDVNTVKKILDVHYNKFNVSLTAHLQNGSVLDKFSCDSGSRCASNGEPVVPDPEVIARFRGSISERAMDGRRGSTNTDTEAPPVFRNALHLAVQHQALAVITLLLKYGVDPNEAGTPQSTVTGRRYGSISEIVHQRDRKDVRFMLCGSSTRVHEDSLEAANGTNGKPEVGSMLLAPSPCPSPLPSPFPSPTHFPKFKDHEDPATVLSLPVPTEPAGTGQGDGPLNYAATYTADVLQGLPPLFLAAAERCAAAVRLLLSYGAAANSRDGHGCTALHLSASVDFQSWECALALIEHGAKVHVTNKYGQAPADLSPDLVKEQARLLSDTLFQSVPVAGGRQLGSTSDLRAGSERLGSRLLKRWNSDRHSETSKGRGSRSRRSRESRGDGDRDDRDGGPERERTSSVSSTKSRWSFNFKFSQSPPQSHLDDIEMESKSADPEKVGNFSLILFHPIIPKWLSPMLMNIFQS